MRIHLICEYNVFNVVKIINHPIITDIILFGWWFGTLILCFHSVGNFIIPTDELIFFRGVGIPPTRLNYIL